MITLVSREKGQAPPPHIVWDALTDPFDPSIRRWLELLPNEVLPEVIDAVRPHHIVWTSLWPDRPRDQIRFSIASDGRSGSRVKWTLETPDEPPDEAIVRDRRRRIDLLINGNLRDSFDL